MLYEFLKWVLKTALRVFYRKIHVTGRHNIPSGGPLIVVSNHPNTLMDPLLVAANLQQQAYFMAKSSFFSTPFLKWLLPKLHMIPVYRAQDQKEAGKSAAETLEANRQIFSRCIEFLKADGTLLIFPEGTSILERKLREIKTGTARIALGAIAEGLPEVQILPVGLNYSDANRFRSEVTVNIGTPISVSAFKTEFIQKPQTAVQNLTRTIRQRLEELLIINNDAEEDSLLVQIESLYADKLMQELNLPVGDPQKVFEVKQAIATAISYFTKYDPVRVRSLHQKITNYLQALKRMRLQDNHLHGKTSKNATFFKLAGGLLLAVFGFPFFVYGLALNYLPYKIPGLAAGKLTEDEEFEAPIMMVTGLFTFPFWYLICLFVFSQFTDSVFGLLIFGLSLPLLGFFALYYYARVVSLRGQWQLLYLLSGRKHLVQELRAERARIVAMLVEARKDYLEQKGKTGLEDI